MGDAGVDAAVRMEAQQHLAGRIAHDLNNHLSALLGYGELLGEMLEGSLEARSYLTRMLRVGERIRAFAWQLQAFSENQVIHPRAADLNDIIRGVEDQMREALGGGVALALDLDRDPLPVEVDVDLVERALLALVEKEREASEGGGGITLSTIGTSSGSGEVCRLRLQVLGARGDGAQRSERYFEPAGGLGHSVGEWERAVIYGIVQQHGGRVAVDDSAAGRVVEIDLPASGVVAPA